MQAYSDPKRADDPHALPDVEVFYLDRNAMWTVTGDALADDSEPGWYWWFCFPGCLPDGDPVGPFDTEADALADAQGEGE